MKTAAALEQIDAALKLVDGMGEDRALGRERSSHLAEFMFSTIARLTLPNSTYREKIIHLRKVEAESYDGYVVKYLVGVLRALRAEISAGYVQHLSGLLRADTFADFLSMAQHLLDEGYKDPAAVLAGSVLEQHLRALCESHQLDTALPDGRWKKADTLNADLAKKEVYSKLSQKSVTSWLGLRNEAAHGNYGSYEEANVRLMLDGISLFMQQHPS